MLTNKQKQLLSFLIKRIEQDGISPSYEEICLELNLKSKSGIHRIVKALEERGYIEHLENKARAIAPTKYPNGQHYVSNVIDINKLLHPKDRDNKERSNEYTKKYQCWEKLQQERQLKQSQIMINLLMYLKIIYFPKKVMP